MLTVGSTPTMCTMCPHGRSPLTSETSDIMLWGAEGNSPSSQRKVIKVMSNQVALVQNKPVFIQGDAVSHYETWTKEYAKERMAETEQAVQDKKILPNRLARRIGIKKYQKSMNDGLWDKRRSQEVIMLDKNGYIRAGQHRVYGFINSDLREITFVVVRDATEEEIASQDDGIARSFNDRTTMYTHVPTFNTLNVNKTISCARLLVSVADGVKSDEPQTSAKLDDIQVALTEMDRLAVNYGRVKTSIPLMAAFAYVYPYMETDVWEDAFCQLDSGTGIVADSAIHKLQKLIENSPAWTRRSEESFLKAVCALKGIHTGKVPGYLTASAAHLDKW